MDQTIRPDGLLVGSGDKTVRLDTYAPLGLLVGIGGTIFCGLLYAGGNQAAIAGSWVFGWYFWLTITLGMFGLTILNHTIRPTWAVALLRIFEAGGGPLNFVMMALLFLPIVIHPQAVYPWADPAAVAADNTGTIAHKFAWFNQGAWSARFFIWFFAWTAFSWGLKHSARRQELTGNARLEQGRSSWGAVGIVFFFLTVSFATFDFAMGLEPKWYSTMFAPWQIISFALGACSLAVGIACVNARRHPYDTIVSPNLTKDWGNILFMLTMLWAYTAVSQFLIIWNGNLPDTAQYYARRTMMGWNAIGMVTIVGQFLVPWMSLLSPRVKRYPRLLSQIAGWIFVIHVVDVYLAVGPGLPVQGQPLGSAHRAAGDYIWFDILAFFTIGGFWLYAFANQVKKAPLLVGYDHRLQEALVDAH